MTQNMHMGKTQGFGSSPRGSHRVRFGPDPSHPTSAGPHLDVGEHQAGSKPADCWGQQNHSLKEKVLRQGRTSWVSASAHGTLPSQPHSPQPRTSLGALGRDKLSAASPGLPGIAPLSKALLGATCPSHTSSKSQQEHTTSLPGFHLSVKEPKIIPLFKVCSPRDLRFPDEIMLVRELQNSVFISSVLFAP